MVNPLSVDFYNVHVNSFNPPQTIWVQNMGPDQALLSATNSCALEFSVTNMCMGYLSSGMSCNIQIQFRPNRPGMQSCGIWINDSMGGGSHYVSVMGQAVSPVVMPDEPADDETAN
jgi:hypothetical protein